MMMIGQAWPCAMIDLETLGTAPGSVVLEVGAVLFCPKTGQMGPHFAQEVAMRAPDQQEREIDEETMMWWMERVKEGVMMPGLHGGADSLRWVCEGLGEFFRQYLDPSGKVWSWGTDFDLGILADAHRDFGIELPWRYHRQRDARTLCKELGVERDGDVAHRALEDAIQEAAAVMKALRSFDKAIIIAAYLRNRKGGAA